MVRAPGEQFASPKLAACLAILLVSAGLLAPLAAQDQSQNNAGNSPCIERPAVSPGALSPESIDASPAAPPVALHKPQPGQTALAAGNSAAAPDADRDSPASSSASSAGCSTPPAALAASGYLSSYFSSEALADTSFPQNPSAAALTTPSKYPVSSKTGKWGGEQWRPAILQTLGFTIAQNGYRLATEEKTRNALVKETWHSYWVAISGLHTWSDGGKAWTVYVAHPAQGAIFNDIWTEHDPHGALVPFGFNHAYWGSRIKAFWWDSVWELQWKFGPFSEASIGNVGLKPGKLGANTIVSSAFIGTGLAVAEDMADRYAIAKWEKKTNNRAARALLRSTLNPDRSFANLFRKKFPWYRDTRPTLRDVQP